MLHDPHQIVFADAVVKIVQIHLAAQGYGIFAQIGNKALPIERFVFPQRLARLLDKSVN